MTVRGKTAHSPHSSAPYSVVSRLLPAPPERGAEGYGCTARRVIVPCYPPRTGGYSMLTDFQKRKLTALFNLYDVDKNGFVDQADFEQVVQNLATPLRLQPGSPEYTRLHAARMASSSNVQPLARSPVLQRVTP